MNEYNLLVFVAICSLAFEYIDASIGMGYGTILSPVLLAMGFVPLDAVPAVLIGQLAGGITGGIAHYKFGNVHLDFHKDETIKHKFSLLIPRSLDAKVILLISACGIVGAIISVLIAVNIPKLVMQTYIGIMVLAIGIIVLVRLNKVSTVSWKGLIGLGLISSFNKGISGGGYGPIVTSGQLASGREVRNSVGSTTITEVTVCAVSFLSYLFLKTNINWSLAIAAITGACIGSPLAALTIKRVNNTRTKIIVGIATCIIGAFTLCKTFLF